MSANKIIIAKKPFRCAYCYKIKTGPYKIVDDNKSCEVCNRAYDYVAPKLCAECPTCKGKGYLIADMSVPEKI